MKNFKYTSTSRIIVLFIFVLAIACKEESEELSLSRQFSPAKITSVNGETNVTIAWSSSLFTTLGEVSYTVEISDNAADFSNPVYTATVSTEGVTTTKDGGIGIVVTDDKLAIKKDYFARVKAIGTEDRADSNWLLSGAFRILGEQFLIPVTSDNVIDKGVRLYWKPNTALDKITITPDGGGTPIEVTLTDVDKAASVKIVTGLSENTSYTAEIFAGTKTKGTTAFKTKLSFKGNVIDLTGTTGNPGILVTTLTSAPSGSTIVLKRGESYTLSTSYALSKSVTIVSGLDYGTDKAIIRSSASFNFVANSTIDSIVFKDLIIKGGRANRASYDNDYLINASAAATISKVRLENCIVKILRGVVRGQTSGSGTKFSNLFINNCVIDSVRDFGVIAASNASAFANIKITNSTLYKARKFIIHAVTGNTSLALENCTFNEVPSGTAVVTTNYFIDLGVSNSNLSIKNCIIGKVWDETVAGVLASGYKAGTSATSSGSNSYFTSDFTTSSPVPNLSSYSSASTSLFTDPSNGTFKFKDANFVGKGTAGDPRWR